MKKRKSIKINSIKKLSISLSAVLCFTVSDVYAYSDIPKGHWAEKYIQTMSDKEIMRGIGNNEFGLGKPVKRGEFVTMLAKLMNWEIFQGGRIWYEPYVQAAYSHNITSDKDFRADDYITRGEMANMLIRALGFSEIDSGNSPFGDVNDPYITAAYDFGIISGKSENTFAPNDYASREESAVMMSRLYDKYSKKIDFLHGFYAISSWSQKEFAAKTDSISFGWSRLEYDDAKGVFLNTTSENNNDWRIPDGSEEAINYFTQNNIPINLAVIMNTEQKGKNGEDACRTILLNEENRKKAIERIVNASSEFNGITIDFEGMKGEELKNGLNLFLTELRQSLPTEKVIYTAVHPIMSGEYYDGYDYNTIGKISDTVIVMAHDYGAASMREEERNAGFTTTPVTPFNQIYIALKEATRQIDDKNKITLALSLASTACWTLDDSGKVINEYSEHPSRETVEKRLSQTDTTIEYSEKYRNPKAEYTDDNGNKTVLWYENSQSVYDKIMLARMFGINKISIWRIGQITDDIWYTIEKMR